MNASAFDLIFERLDEIIGALEHDENTFYVAIDLAHQLRAELEQIRADD